MFSNDPVDREVLAASTGGTGAVVVGRHLDDIVDGPHGWTDEVGYSAGLVDELRLHLAPVLLGGGPPLFDAGAAPRPLRRVHVRVSAHATHLTYRVD